MAGAKRRQRGANCIQCPQVMMRASVQHAIGGYDAELPRSRDLETWMRAALVDDVGRVNGAAQGFYLVHEHSRNPTSSPREKSEALAGFDIVPTVFATHRSEALSRHAADGLVDVGIHPKFPAGIEPWGHEWTVSFRTLLTRGLPFVAPIRKAR